MTDISTVHINAEQHTGPVNIVAMRAWYRILTERDYRFTRSESWTCSTPTLDLPKDAKCEASADEASRQEHRRVYSVGHPPALVHFIRDRSNIYAHVAAVSQDDCDKVMGQLMEQYPRTTYTKTTVPMSFWYLTPNGPASMMRQLDVPEWINIKRNYTKPVQEEVARLIDPAFRPSQGGQLILMDGVPGTGKTWMIRSLAKSWSEWCSTFYIVDPDAFFDHAYYMMQALLSDTNQPYKLIIIEDAGELMSKDAKSRTGQALSRLLNIADGMVGQGLKVLILITTNEAIGTLHEAVARPGRCASKMTFDKLSYEESQQWLRDSGYKGAALEKKQHTLAELYARLGDWAKPMAPSHVMGFGTNGHHDLAVAEPSIMRIGMPPTEPAAPFENRIHDAAKKARLMEQYGGRSDG